MFDNYRRSKIKNIKVQNWRLEVSNYRFDVVYRPGPLDYIVNALTRDTKIKEKYEQIGSISLEENLLNQLHRDLGWPGITRLFHQVKIRNFPYT